jgi:cell division protein FtsB
MTRNYATKFIFSLILITIILFSIFQAIFGEKGVIANHYLSAQIEALDQQVGNNQETIGTLEETSTTLKTPTYITQVMNKVGYVQKGQSLYILPKDQNQDNVYELKGAELPVEERPLTLSLSLNMAISFGISLLLTIVIYSLARSRKRKKGKNEKDNFN